MARLGRGQPFKPLIGNFDYFAGVSQALTPSLFSNQNTFYSATITTGAVTLTPSLFANANTFYAPTVAAGAVNLTPGLFANGNTFYGPTVTVGA